MILKPFGVLCRSMVYLLLWLRSLHVGMSATVTVGGGTSKSFSVRNDLRQECIIAPTLFILYFGLVIDRWLSLC